MIYYHYNVKKINGEGWEFERLHGNRRVEDTIYNKMRAEAVVFENLKQENIGKGIEKNSGRHNPSYSRTFPPTNPSSPRQNASKPNYQSLPIRTCRNTTGISGKNSGCLKTNLFYFPSPNPNFAHNKLSTFNFHIDSKGDRDS